MTCNKRSKKYAFKRKIQMDKLEQATMELVCCLFILLLPGWHYNYFTSAIKDALLALIGMFLFLLIRKNLKNFECTCCRWGYVEHNFSKLDQELRKKFGNIPEPKPMSPPWLIDNWDFD